MTQIPSDTVNAIRRTESAVFDEHLVPKAWAMEFSCVSNGSSFILPTRSTGRLELRITGNLNEDVALAEACTNIERVVSSVPGILAHCGVDASLVSDFVVSDVCLHVAFQRCQRQPFIACGDYMSGPFEEILILLPMKHGFPIALLKQDSIPTHLDGRPDFAMPELYLGDALVMTETNFSLLSTTIVEQSLFANAFILVRLSLRCGFIASQANVQFPFNQEPERTLICASQQPPISICAICLGPIRERRHANLGGVRAEQDMLCSLFHCPTCRALRPTGLFLLCEFCIKAKVCPFQITEARNNTDSLIRLYSYCFGSTPVCVHKGFVRNTLVDTLFMLFNPHEFIAGARAFLDFYLNATWHESFAPRHLIDLCSPGKSKELWAAFYEHFIMNAHCPRVRMVVYAIQCALNTGPVLRRYGSSLPTKGREVFLQGDLRSRYNQRGVRVCIFPRVLLAADLAHGLFTPAVLREMSIRVFKYLQVASFNTNVACCCTPVQGTNVPLFPVLNCRGPVLDLSNEMGQPHHYNPRNDSERGALYETWRRINNWQRDLRQIIARRDFTFNKDEHFVLPGPTTSMWNDDSRYLS